MEDLSFFKNLWIFSNSQIQNVTKQLTPPKNTKRVNFLALQFKSIELRFIITLK